MTRFRPQSVKQCSALLSKWGDPYPTSQWPPRVELAVVFKFVTQIKVACANWHTIVSHYATGATLEQRGRFPDALSYRAFSLTIRCYQGGCLDQKNAQCSAERLNRQTCTNWL